MADQNLTNSSNLAAWSPTESRGVFGTYFDFSAVSLAVSAPVLAGFGYIGKAYIIAHTPYATPAPIETELLFYSFYGVDSVGKTVGSPVIGAPTISVNMHLLSAASKTVGSPAIGVPVFVQPHRLFTLEALTVSAPVLGQFVPSFHYFWEAASLEVTAPELPTPVLNQRVYRLEAVEFEVAALELTSADLDQPHHALVAADLTTAPPEVLGLGVVRHVDMTAASFAVFQPLQFGAPSVSRYVMAADLEVSAPVLGAPYLYKTPIHVEVAAPITWRGSDILYRAATGMERAAADIDGARITAVPAELIQDIWDPDTCPVALLPYLAWAYGVQFWNDRWSEITKRQWVKYQLLMKSNRGKKAGLRMAVDYAGRDVSRWGYRINSITTRPQTVFSGPSLTKTERETWLQALPQVRSWNVQESSAAPRYKAFYGAANSLRQRDHRFCFGGAYATPSTAIQRLHRKARWVEKGVETDITVTEFGNYFQVHKPGVEDAKVFSNRPITLKRFYQPSSAWERLLTIRPKLALPWRSALTPSLQAVTSEPDLVREPGERDHHTFCDTPLYDNFFVPSTASMRVFRRYAVLDPSVREFRRPPVQFMGTGRYGFPSFTARVDVSLGKKQSKWTAGFGYYEPRLKFFIPHDEAPLAYVREAVKSSKALRDKILLKTGPTRRFIASGRPILAGIDTVIVGRP